MKQKVLSRLKGGLIVSCQALESEPLYSSYIMSRMAVAAVQGGAVGIRANSVADILEIKKSVSVPVIGLIKKEYKDSEVFITPTMEEVQKLISSGVEIIAMDGTGRLRPNGQSLADFWRVVKEQYPNQLFMADCSNYEEGIIAAKLGFDLIGTTLRGYTQDTIHIRLPDVKLVESLSKAVSEPVIAEGGIMSPQQLKLAFQAGAFAAVVGTAITRPREITGYFIDGSGCRKTN
ncbi:N-acetylmannosamine-6-phosphate 2-epimerase [Clostridium sp. E02]|uniref:N-acetylmannosamine-6-phosphate 2-epimerase n=1 Tax=Clostridium sp. E02 TaxID=2487134 RepID=UPI000F534240|nr:N-acetylmannosamine-6-phosphate 2-epimerase [Clostridium sp. E02]